MIYRYLISILFLAQLIHSQDQDSIIYKKPKNAFILSFFPGGGQLYNGKFIKSILFIGLESVAIYSWSKNSDIYKNYDNNNYPLNRNRYLEKRNKYAWWIGFFYFFGMLDAVVDAHLDPFDKVMNSEIEDSKPGEN
tara:strand:- start:25977 stop:26384 length:408 start_codon:yes stop_codon:yes gene_type:complete